MEEPSFVRHALVPDVGLATSSREETDPAALGPWALGLTGGITMAVWIGSIGLLARVGWGERWRTPLADGDG